MKATAIPAERPAARDILEEHIEEMAFLWIQRRKLLFSTDVATERCKHFLINEACESIADRFAGKYS